MTHQIGTKAHLFLFKEYGLDEIIEGSKYLWKVTKKTKREDMWEYELELWCD